MAEGVDDALDAGVRLIVVRGVIPSLPKLLHLVGVQTEEEDVLVAHFLVDLHIGAVQRAHGEGAVDHELHVAGAARLLAGDGDLLADFRGGHDELRKGDAVVLEEDHLQLAVDVGVVVDDLAEGADEADDLLRHIIGGSRLRPEDESAGFDVESGVLFQAEIEVENVQRVQELTLVLMQPLDLHVEDGVRVDGDAVRLLDVRREPLLVAALDVGELHEDVAVAHIAHEILQFVRVREPAVSDEVGDERGELRVRLRHPAAVSDAVGHVGELLGVHRVVVAEDVVLQDVGVQRADAVYRVRGDEAEVRHLDLPFREHRIPRDGVPVGGIELPELAHEALIDLVHDLIDAGEQSLKEILRPLFERLRHDGVVGVGDAARGDVPRLLPAHAVLVEEDAHELRYAEGGMGVVDVDGDAVREVVKRGIGLEVPRDDALYGRGHEEILLFEPERLALDVVVGGIKHLGDGLRHRLCRHRLDVLPSREHGHVEVHRRLARPQSDAVDGVGVIAGDVHVIGHGEHRRIVALTDGEPAVVPIFVHHAAELDLIGLLGTGRKPHAAHLDPFVGLLELPSVHDDLLEDAVVVHDGETAGGIALGSEGVHIRRGEPAETAVAQPRVGLEGVQLVEVGAERLHRLCDLVGDAHVEEMVPERPAEQELHGHIVDLFGVLFAHALFEVDARLRQDVAHGDADGAVKLRLACILRLDAEKPREQGNDLRLELFCCDVVRCHLITLFLPFPPSRVSFFFYFRSCFRSPVRMFRSSFKTVRGGAVARSVLSLSCAAARGVPSRTPPFSPECARNIRALPSRQSAPGAPRTHAATPRHMPVTALRCRCRCRYTSLRTSPSRSRTSCRLRPPPSSSPCRRRCRTPSTPRPAYRTHCRS